MVSSKTRILVLAVLLIALSGAVLVLRGQLSIQNAQQAEKQARMTLHLENKNKEKVLLQSLLKDGKLEDIEGKLIVRHGHDFENDVLLDEYSIRTSKGDIVRLHFKEYEVGALPPAGSTIKVHAKKKDADAVVAAEIGGTVQTLVSAYPPTTFVPGPKKVAVILFTFTNDTRQPWTADQVRSNVFTSNTSVNRYYTESSYGKMKLVGKLRTDGDVFGWYQIPLSNLNCEKFDVNQSWADAAQIKAQANGFNAANYDYFVYVFPSPATCGTIGWTWAYSDGTWGNESWTTQLSPQVQGHELGHNFGMNHSNLYSCKNSSNVGVPISTNCNSEEYKDPLDVMSAANYTLRLLNSFHRWSLNFFASSNIFTVEREGEYGILPLGPSTTGIQTLRIKKDDKYDYYLEFRQPYGKFDTFATTAPEVTGVFIRFGSKPNNQSQLIQPTPGSPTIPLKLNQIFDDTVAGVKIKTTFISTTKAKVYVWLQKPYISITAPTENQTVWGTTNVTASAYDSVGVTKVLYYVDGINRYVSTTAPFTWAWNTNKSEYPDGPHTLYAVAYDASNNTGKSQTITLNVDNRDVTNPVATLTAPLQNQVVSGVTTISVNATDNVAVTAVDFFVDFALKGTDTTAPYTYDWNTTSVPNGSHSMSVKAKDAVGNFDATPVISVTVNNGDAVAPVVTLTSPANNATVPVGSITVSATASDNIGVTKVEFYVDGTLKVADITSPYSYVWTSTAGVHSAYAKAFDAAGNVTTTSANTFTVTNIDAQSPVVNISNPLNNQKVSGTVNISASASDNTTVSKMEIYVDGSMKLSCLAANCAYGWSTDFISNGTTHPILVKAYDAANNIGQMTVNAIVSRPPVISTINPASGTIAKGGTFTSTTSASTATSYATYLAGDLTHDGRVDFSDNSLFSAAFYSTQGSPLYNAEADFNSDGKIDFSDNSIFSANFYKSAPVGFSMVGNIFKWIVPATQPAGLVNFVVVATNAGGSDARTVTVTVQ